MLWMCVWKYWIVKISMNSLLQSPCSLMRLKGQRQNVLFLFEIFSPPDFQLSKPFLNSKLIRPISIRGKIERKLKVVGHKLNLFSSWISIVSLTVSLAITIPSCLQHNNHLEHGFHELWEGTEDKIWYASENSRNFSIYSFHLLLFFNWIWLSGYVSSLNVVTGASSLDIEDRRRKRRAAEQVKIDTSHELH